MSSTADNFRELGLSDEVLQSIEDDLGFDAPTPIQREAIPLLSEGRDLIGKAETGTGKTLAFCAPLMGKIDPSRRTVQALVLCPTRELAQQVEEVAAALGQRSGIRSVLLVGGVHQSEQILSLREGAQVAVGTPGRVLDFLREGVLRLGWANTAVLDEADRMLDMGFIEDVSEILQSMPKERQTLMFSATVPPRLERLSKRFMNKPATVSTIQGMATVPEIHQRYVQIHPGDKEGFVLDLIDAHPEDTCIIFCNTRKEVIELDRTLWGMGYDAGSLHGDHEQERRFKVLEGFKSRQIMTLVATDVAARGLDIEKVTRVVNFDIPDEVETYVHRIGRTGRAGGVGEAIALVSNSERENWDRIRRSTGSDVEEITDWEPSRPRKKVETFDKRRRFAEEKRTSAVERMKSKSDSKSSSGRGRGRGRDESRSEEEASTERGRGGKKRTRRRSGRKRTSRSSAETQTENAELPNEEVLETSASAADTGRERGGREDSNRQDDTRNSSEEGERRPRRRRRRRRRSGGSGETEGARREGSDTNDERPRGESSAAPEESRETERGQRSDRGAEGENGEGERRPRRRRRSRRGGGGGRREESGDSNQEKERRDGERSDKERSNDRDDSARGSGRSKKKSRKKQSKKRREPAPEPEPRKARILDDGFPEDNFEDNFALLPNPYASGLEVSSPPKEESSGSGGGSGQKKRRRRRRS